MLNKEGIRGLAGMWAGRWPLIIELRIFNRAANYAVRIVVEVFLRSRKNSTAVADVSTRTGIHRYSKNDVKLVVKGFTNLLCPCKICSKSFLEYCLAVGYYRAIKIVSTQALASIWHWKNRASTCL